MDMYVRMFDDVRRGEGDNPTITMTDHDQKQLGKTLWDIADQLRGAMNADDFRDYMLSFLFLRYLSDNYEAAAKKELGRGLSRARRIGNDRRVAAVRLVREEPGRRAGVREADAPQGALRHPAPITSGPASPTWPARRTANCSTRCRPASSTSRTNPSRAPSRACSRRSISARTSSARTTQTATPSSAPSSARSPKGWRNSPPTATRWAMPTNT